MFSQIFIRSTTCRLNSTLCRRHFAILALLAILPPFAAKCVFSACLTLGVQSISDTGTPAYLRTGRVAQHPSDPIKAAGGHPSDFILPGPSLGMFTGRHSQN